MEETSFLIASETALLLLAKACQVGGSLGLIASDLAEWIMEQEPSMMNDPDSRIGCCALRPSSAILAGTEANSGLLANWQRLSTASMRGPVAFEHVLRFESELLASSCLISLTRVAVALATSLADWTKWRLAAGLEVLDEARRHELQRELVCLAMTVAEERISCWLLAGLHSFWQAALMAC